MANMSKRRVILEVNGAHAYLNRIKECYPFSQIHQGYLARYNSLMVRIQKTIRNMGETSCVMTIKKGIGQKLVEIKTDINESDFNDLWKTVEGKLYKIRVHLNDSWDVDFFFDKVGNIYFVLAENASGNDDTLPESIQEEFIFEVSANDKRFSNSKLSDRLYATAIMDGVQSLKRKEVTA